MSVTESDMIRTEQVPARPAAKNGSRVEQQDQPYDGSVARISTARICRMISQLATLLRAGMPLVPALSALIEQLQSVPRNKVTIFSAGDDALIRVLLNVRDKVNAGSTLSGAMGRYPRIFSPVIVSMVAAGQAGGNLEEVLLRVAEMLEKRTQLISKVKAAVAYPLMMIVVAVGVVVFLLSYVVPSITQIFLEMNRTLPWPTRMLISVSAFFESYLLFVAIGVCLALFAIWAVYKTKDGRLFADRVRLKIPLFGRLFVRAEIARLTRTLSMLLASGIPMVRALEIVKGVTQNVFLASAIGSIKDMVSRGDSVAVAIKRAGFFPPVVYHIVATSQISANLESGLRDVADMYDNEVEMTAKTLTSLLEPVVLLFMGCVVGFIVLAILLPIFDINQTL